MREELEPEVVAQHLPPAVQVDSMVAEQAEPRRLQIPNAVAAAVAAPLTYALADRH
jgi:hypothetical protein